MVTESQIYWITRLDDLKGFAEIIGIVSAIVGTTLIALAFIFLFLGAETKNEKKFCKILLSVLPPLYVAGLLLGITSIFIPTTKEMCAIKVIPIIANDEEVKQLPKDFVGLAHEWMEELKPQKPVQEVER